MAEKISLKDRMLIESGLLVLKTECDSSCGPENFSHKGRTGEADGDVDASGYPAAAAIIIKDGRILCATRRDDGSICGPGGHIEECETPEGAAIRETMEEFNIVPLSLLPLGDYKGSTGLYLPSKIYFTDRFSGIPEADGDEMLDAKWLSMKELREKRLYPPFAESLNLLEELLKNYLTTSNSTDTLTLDGAPKGNQNAAGPHKRQHLSDKDKAKYSRRIIGQKTSDGVEVKKISNHAFDRIAQRNLSPKRIENMLQSEKVSADKTYPNSRSCYDIEGSRLVLDHTNGTIVTIEWRSQNK